MACPLSDSRLRTRYPINYLLSHFKIETIILGLSTLPDFDDLPRIAILQNIDVPMSYFTLMSTQLECDGVLGDFTSIEYMGSLCITKLNVEILKNGDLHLSRILVFVCA
jgi:hypothetical protein